MKHSILFDPSFSMLEVELEKGGESFFINEFRSTEGKPAKVTIAPTLCGAIIHK